MYASAMKFCGAMELCGIGYPRGQSYDQPWPEIEAQVAAQRAGLLVAITRDRDPEEANLMRAKGFAAVYQFTNPRTGNPATLWIKDFTGCGGPVTKLPKTVAWTGGPPGLPRLDAAPTEEHVLDGIRAATGLHMWATTHTNRVNWSCMPEAVVDAEAPF